MPRITWLRLPFTCGADDAEAAGAGAEDGAGALEHDTTNNDNTVTASTRIDATSIKNAGKVYLHAAATSKVARYAVQTLLSGMLSGSPIPTLVKSEEFMKIV
jgi:hypothetical protein